LARFGLISDGYPIYVTGLDGVRMTKISESDRRSRGRPGPVDPGFRRRGWL